MFRNRIVEWTCKCIVLIVLTLAKTTEGRPLRVSQIPSGKEFGCSACHVDNGKSRNIFGIQIEEGFLSISGFSGEVIWGPELAALDADGDGVSNGVELGDPSGIWKPGDEISKKDISRPWDSASKPALSGSTSTLVRLQTWTYLKIKHNLSAKDFVE